MEPRNLPHEPAKEARGEDMVGFAVQGALLDVGDLGVQVPSRNRRPAETRTAARRFDWPGLPRPAADSASRLPSTPLNSAHPRAAAHAAGQRGEIDQQIRVPRFARPASACRPVPACPSASVCINLDRGAVQRR